MVAFAWLGAIETLDVEKLRRVLQPVFVHRSDLSDARVGIETRRLGRRPGNVPFPFARRARRRGEAQQIIADGRSGAWQANNDERRIDRLRGNFGVDAVILDEPQPGAELPDDVVRRQMAQLVIGLHRLDRHDEPLEAVAPAGIRTEFGQSGSLTRCGFQPGDSQRRTHPIAFAIMSIRSA